MLGKRKAQASLFDAIGLPHRVPANSFYRRMGSLNGKLLRDDDLKEMYTLDNGRPSLPPSMMAGVLLLQFHDDVLDGEAVERVLYDMRWKRQSSPHNAPPNSTHTAPPIFSQYAPGPG